MRLPPAELPKGFVPRAGARKSRFDADSREEQLKTTNPTPAQRQRALALPKEEDSARKEPTQSDEQIRDGVLCTSEYVS